MAVYVAMLRGINVGGHRPVKMDQLRQSFAGLGFEQIKTYIQSGNLVFKAGRSSPSGLSRRIEKKILADFGFPVSVVVRTREEVDEAVGRNPFLQQHGIDTEKLHVTFLSEVPSLAALKKLGTLTVAPDQACCLARELYLYLPNGVAESSLMKTPLDRTLSVVATTRNWKTVNRLHQLCQECR